MRLSDIMTKRVITLPLHSTIEEAREEMRRHDVHHLLVVEHGRAVGVLSARDCAEGRTGKAESWMRAPIVSARARTTVREAANAMRGQAIGCLPVCDDDDRLVGIVTISDLLELIGRGTQKPIAESIPWTQTRRPSRAQKRR